MPTVEANEKHPRGGKAAALAVALPLVLALLAYARTLRGEFLFDDLRGIVENGAARSVVVWLRNLSLDAMLAERPLTTLTFAANYALGRLDPAGYHAVNVALHLAVVLLLHRLTLRVAALAGAPRPRTIAAGVAGLFAVHPLHSQAVSYLSQRAEVLASALYVLALLLLLPPEGGRKGATWRPAAAFAAFVLGLAAKPILVTLPAASLAIRLAAARADRAEWRRELPALAGLGLAALAFAAGLLAALRGRPDAGFSVADTTPWIYLLTQLRASLAYLRLLAWPSGQSADWAFPSSPGLGDPATALSGVAVAALLALAVVLLVRGRRAGPPAGPALRLAGLGILWFFVLIAPTSSLVPLADNLVEHRVYLASWGVLLAVVAALDALVHRHGGARAAVALWLAALLALTAALHRRNAVWESREALWTDVLSTNPASARARAGLGEALAAGGRMDEAVQQYRLALAHSEGKPGRQAWILFGLGSAQLAAGRPEEARRTLLAALPLLPRNGDVLAALAAASGASGEPAEAERHAREALRWSAAHPVAWLVLGNLALEGGDWPGAVAAYDRATAADAELGEAHYGRALALSMLGRGPEECAAYRAALRARLAPAYRASVEEAFRSRCGATGAVR